MKHKADGLYYVNLAMITAAHACRPTLVMFKRKFGTRDVPLTLENAHKAQANGISLDWALNRMHRIGAVPFDEWVVFDEDHVGAPKRFMDIVASRAKREGKL